RPQRRGGGCQHNGTHRSYTVSISTTAAGARAVRRYGARERAELVTGHRFDDFYAANFGRLTVQLYAYVGDMTEAQVSVQEAFCPGAALLRQQPGRCVMDEFERDAEVIGTRLSAFDREVGTEVRMPGADEVRRTAFRRQRARTGAVGVLAFAALAGMVGVVVADRHDPGGTAGPAATASAEPAASPSPEATGSPGAESPAA